MTKILLCVAILTSLDNDSRNFICILEIIFRNILLVLQVEKLEHPKTRVKLVNPQRSLCPSGDYKRKSFWLRSFIFTLISKVMTPELLLTVLFEPPLAGPHLSLALLHPTHSAPRQTFLQYALLGMDTSQQYPQTNKLS